MGNFLSISNKELRIKRMEVPTEGEYFHLLIGVIYINGLISGVGVS